MIYKAKYITIGILLIAFVSANPNTDGFEKYLAPNFLLKDANNSSFSLSETTNTPSILCFLSKTPDNEIGRYWMDESHKWINSWKEYCSVDVPIVIIKDMTNVPKWMPKYLVKQKLNNEPNRILIDWEGVVCKRYKLENFFTLYVIDSEKNIVYKTSEPYDENEFIEASKYTKALFERKKND